MWNEIFRFQGREKRRRERGKLQLDRMIYPSEICAQIKRDIDLLRIYVFLGDPSVRSPKDKHHEHWG